MTLTFPSERAVTRALDEMADRSGDLRPAFGRMVQVIHRRERDVFQSGGGWRPLKRVTLRNKQRRGESPRVLIARGALMRSLTTPNAAGSIVRVTRSSAQVGTSLPYARFVNKRRPVFKVRGKDRREMSRIIARHVIGGDA